MTVSSRRRQVIAAMALNAVLAAALATGIALARPSLTARYRPDFPANMLLLRNRGGRLERVVLELDGRWVHRGATLERGMQGFEVHHAFEDAEESRPPAGYVPKRLRVVHAGGSFEIPVEAEDTGR